MSGIGTVRVKFILTQKTLEGCKEELAIFLLIYCMVLLPQLIVSESKKECYQVCRCQAHAISSDLQPSLHFDQCEKFGCREKRNCSINGNIYSKSFEMCGNPTGKYIFKGRKRKTKLKHIYRSLSKIYEGEL